MPFVDVWDFFSERACVALIIKMYIIFSEYSAEEFQKILRKNNNCLCPLIALNNTWFLTNLYWICLINTIRKPAVISSKWFLEYVKKLSLLKVVSRNIWKTDSLNIWHATSLIIYLNFIGTQMIFHDVLNVSNIINELL